MVSVPSVVFVFLFKLNLKLLRTNPLSENGVVQDCNSITGLWCTVPPCCSLSVYLFISPRRRSNGIVRLNRSWKLSAQPLVRHLNFPRKQPKANHHIPSLSTTFPCLKPRNRSFVHISVAGHLIFFFLIVLKHWGNITQFFYFLVFQIFVLPCFFLCLIFSLALCSHLPLQLDFTFGWEAKSHSCL